MKNRIKSYYKFPIERCTDADFESKNYTLPEWVKLKEQWYFCPKIKDNHKLLWKLLGYQKDLMNRISFSIDIDKCIDGVKKGVKCKQDH